MVVLRYILLGIYFIVCVGLIVMVTIQNKEGSGASGTITGSSSNNFFEKNKSNTKEGKMKKMTIILGIVFVVIAITLSVINVL
ncbi:MAG: preprotein translocase subunit SecG [Clostridia bacterium]|nr:preprotein translocase subunit SecG [Clostridia bacterium]